MDGGAMRLLPLLLPACAAAIASQAMAAQPSSEIELGRQLYQTHCASCHGRSGEGQLDWQKADAAGELPAPPHDSTGHTWRHTDRELEVMIEMGWRDPFNATSRLTMPAFDSVLPRSDVRAIITYLKTLWTPQERADQAQKTQESSTN